MENTNPTYVSERPGGEPAFPWYAVRTFNCQELKISRYLQENGKEHFIPMTYAEKRTHEGKPKRVLVPVVHNMLFVRKDEPQKQMLHLFSSCNVPLHVMKKEGTTDCYEIPDIQMTEFRMLCDPGFDGTQFLTADEADAKPGKEVMVIHGPFSGMTGKLHRVKNGYYFIKTLAGVGVMLRISRWYCKVLPEKQ